VFTFINEVLEDKREYYAFEDIEHLRNLMLKNKKTLIINDLGAGSRVYKTNERTVSQIARTSLSSADEGQFLFRLMHHLRPKTIVELGTSLGISSLYVSKALSSADIVTIEGCASIASVTSLIGDFADILPQLLKLKQEIDCIYIDGNHQYQPTIDYFEMSLPHLHENSFVIFDDIYWSPDMTRAWECIKNHPRVTLTIDLFQFGIVFFRTEQKQKEHYKIVPTKWKFWRTGLWTTQ
jgi:predicted O-methyltransferase YrrM